MAPVPISAGLGCSMLMQAFVGQSAKERCARESPQQGERKMGSQEAEAELAENQIHSSRGEWALLEIMAPDRLLD